MALSSDWQSRKNLSFTNLFMMENNIATDIQFVFPDETSIDAHKFILMSRSNVFYVMFEGSIKETKKAIKIEDIEHDVFQQMLR